MRHFNLHYDHVWGALYLPHSFGILFHAYVVDLWARMEQERLKWMRFNQNTIRVEIYRA